MREKRERTIVQFRVSSKKGVEWAWERNGTVKMFVYKLAGTALVL